MTRHRRCHRTNLRLRRAAEAAVALTLLLSHPFPRAIAATTTTSESDAAEEAKRTSRPQTPYLKEILLGRCYDSPPTPDVVVDVDGSGGSGSPDDCPLLVGDLVSSFESNLDADVTIESYSKYFDVADFTAPPDRALFVSRFSVDRSNRGVGRKPYPPFVRVRDTPGGSMMAGLTFCGADVRSDCPQGKGGAWGSFWEGAHEKFASSATGIVRAIVYEEEEGNGNNSGGGADDGAPPPPAGSSSMMLESAFPKLDVTKITAFAVFLVPPENADAIPIVNCDTSETYAKIKARLQKMGMQKDLIGCTVDRNLTHLRLCEDTPDALHCGGEIIDMAEDADEAKTDDGATVDEASDNDDVDGASAATAALDGKRRKRRHWGHHWLLGRLFWVFTIGSVIFYIAKRTNDREQRYHNPNHHGDAVPMGQYQV